MPGVVGVMTAEDIRGSNRLADDQPLLCDKKVHVMGDAVALVVAEPETRREPLAEAVVVDYEPLTGCRDTGTGFSRRLHPDSRRGTQPLLRSSSDKRGCSLALGKSDEVIEAEFSTQLIHQAPLEPEAALAYLETSEDDEEPKLVVVGRSINIHHHLMVLQRALGWDNMRYEQAFIGGQFGIKIDITAEGLAAAAALHFRRPVRYVCGLTESMWITTKRHPFKMKVRLGADREGKLTAYTMISCSTMEPTRQRARR